MSLTVPSNIIFLCCLARQDQELFYIIIIIPKTAMMSKSAENLSLVAHQSKNIWQSQIRFKIPSRQMMDENTRALVTMLLSDPTAENTTNSFTSYKINDKNIIKNEMSTLKIRGQSPQLPEDLQLEM